MLRYFRQNDPFRVFGLIVILLITRLFFFLLLTPQPELVAIDLYGFEVLLNNNAGPIYQLVLAGLSFILENIYLNALIAGLIILWNATLLNSILIRNSGFEENTYIPAALYVFLLCFDADNYFLSPQLLGTSFLLISFLFLHLHLRFRNSDEKVLSLGCALAIASLIHKPYSWYLVLILILFLFYSGTTGRRYLLLIWGFGMIVLMAWLPFLFGEMGAEFWTSYAQGIFNFQFEREWLINIGIVLALPLLISLKSSISNLVGMGMTNLQITVKRVFTWIGLFGILSILFQSNLSASSSGMLILSMSYFVTEHLLELRKKWLAELVFSGLLILMLAMLYFGPFY